MSTENTIDRPGPDVLAHGALADKVAVITGGGTGIGAAIAHAFFTAGARVVVAGRRAEALNAVASACGGLAVPTDITRGEEVKHLFDLCERTHGRLDVLVNNAGTGGARAAMEHVSLEAWAATIGVNLIGTARCIQGAIPLLARQGGAIVNIASRDGLNGARAGRSDYVASKFAITGLTESLAQELGPARIRVNDICPGAVATDMLTRTASDLARETGRPIEEIWQTRYRDRTALGRIVAPEEVAAAAVFLASDAARSITGIHLKIDAGRA